MAWNIQPSREEIAFLMEAGVIYRDAKRYREAEEIFRGVRALMPRSEVPEVALGTVQFGLGEVKKAIGHYEKALKLNADSAFAHAQLGEAHTFCKDHTLAKQHLNEAIRLDPRGEAGAHARTMLELLNKLVPAAGQQA
jgi:tetratricopeptide (TPR) repeat protein